MEAVIKMNQTKQVHYKAIFKQGDEKQTIEYKVDGWIDYGQKTRLHFQTDQGKIQISFDEVEVHLQNGDSLLRFHKEKKVWNHYQLPYGTVELKTELLKFKASSKMIQMKYALYDHQGMISMVYIMITLKDYPIKVDA